MLMYVSGGALQPSHSTHSSNIVSPEVTPVGQTSPPHEAGVGIARRNQKVVEPKNGNFLKHTTMIVV